MSAKGLNSGVPSGLPEAPQAGDMRSPYLIVLEDLWHEWPGQPGLAATQRREPPLGASQALETALRTIGHQTGGCLRFRSENSERRALGFAALVEPQAKTLRIVSLPSPLPLPRQHEITCLRDALEASVSDDLQRFAATLEHPLSLRVLIVLAANGAPSDEAPLPDGPQNAIP
jgi:hypothetical protein